MEILKKNLFPVRLIEGVVNRDITGTQGVYIPRDFLSTTARTFYFTIPYIGPFQSPLRKRFATKSKGTYCKDLDIKWVFSSFKIGNLFDVKDPIPSGLRPRVAYKLICAGCNACYVGETSRHFFTRVREHLATYRASHVFKHLQDSQHCHSSCSTNCFHILDHTSTSFQLKIKEAIPQLYHVNLKLSL